MKPDFWYRDTFINFYLYVHLILPQACIHLEIFFYIQTNPCITMRWKNFFLIQRNCLVDFFWEYPTHKLLLKICSISYYCASMRKKRGKSSKQFTCSTTCVCTLIYVWISSYYGSSVFLIYIKYMDQPNHVSRFLPYQIFQFV